MNAPPSPPGTGFVHGCVVVVLVPCVLLAMAEALCMHVPVAMLSSRIHYLFLCLERTWY